MAQSGVGRHHSSVYIADILNPSLLDNASSENISSVQMVLWFFRGQVDVRNDVYVMFVEFAHAAV